MKALIKGFITYEIWKGERTGEYRFQKYAPSTSEHYTQILVREHSFEIDVPDEFDPRPEQVRMLREEQQKVRAEMSMRIKELDDQINSLLAIENTVDV